MDEKYADRERVARALYAAEVAQVFEAVGQLSIDCDEIRRFLISLRTNPRIVLEARVNLGTEPAFGKEISINRGGGLSASPLVLSPCPMLREGVALCYGHTSGHESQKAMLAVDLASFAFAEPPGVKSPLSPPSLNAAMSA